MHILKKLRPYTLLIALFIGLICFLFFKFCSCSVPLRPIGHLVVNNVSVMLFIILFLAFLKIDFKQMLPSTWHFILLAFQLLITFIITILLYLFDFEDKFWLEGALICFITPTAASASVITGKIGGNESALTTYIILSNFAAAIGIPLFFPLITELMGQSFFHECLTILYKVSPILIGPLFLAFIVRRFFKKLHHFLITSVKDLGFYLWAGILIVMSAKTIDNIYDSGQSSISISIMALEGLFLTIVHFAVGKGIGQMYNRRISAGQALGQKNMVFGIYISLTYLNPVVAIIPGTYILWQNLVNAFQMWYREKLLVKWQQKGILPYSE